MMDITVDSEVLEQKRLTLRQDTGHISTENRGSEYPVIGSADDSVREGAENSLFDSSSSSS